MTMTQLLRSAVFRRVAVLLLLIATAILAGCVTSPETLPPARKTTAMATPESTSITSNANLTAEEIGKRFLKLIEQLESRNDLSVDGIQSVLGVTLNHVKVPNENLAYYAYGQKLDSESSFSIHYNPASPGLKEGIGLSFGHSEGGDGSVKTVCSPTFDDYHNALKEVGYRDVPIYGEIGELRSWRYYKDDITLSLTPQTVVAGTPGRLCVRSIGTLN